LLLVQVVREVLLEIQRVAVLVEALNLLLVLEH
jgi:hypothetical protein